MKFYIIYKIYRRNLIEEPKKKDFAALEAQDLQKNWKLRGRDWKVNEMNLREKHGNYWKEKE